MTMHYDIAIAGGGLVGTALALALQNSPWRVALIEAKPLQADNRTIVLSHASQQILTSLQVWESIASHTTLIDKIHISEEKRFGKAFLDAKALKLPPFAYATPMMPLYHALQNNLKNIDLICPAKVTDAIQKNNRWELEIEGKKIQATLLIAADGERSSLRESLQLPVKKTDYQQTALVTSASISIPHNNTAYQRFTPQGTLAVLPLQHNHVAIIWTSANNHISALKENFAAEVQSTMGYRLGEFSDFADIQSHPLKSLHADTQALPGFFLLGNAAHILHPIAAQGLNLSLRDAETLANLLKTAKDLRDPLLAEAYTKARNADQKQTEHFTDNLVKLFAPQFLPASLVRSLGLSVFDLFSSIKRSFCLKRMGY